MLYFSHEIQFQSSNTFPQSFVFAITLIKRRKNNKKEHEWSLFVKIWIPFTLLKRAWPFIWRNVNPLHPRMLRVKFGWNWPSGSGENIFINSSECIFTISLSSPLRIGCLPLLEFEQSGIPHHPRMLCAKFGLIWPLWFRRRR